MRDVVFERRDGRLFVTPPYAFTLAAPVTPTEFKQRDKHRAATHGWNPNRLRITMALDARALDGPEVDEALGVPEPTVDEWETGVTIPSREDIARLATLTSFPPGFFFGDDPPEMHSGWICGGKDGCVPLHQARDEPCPHCSGTGVAPPPPKNPPRLLAVPKLFP